MFVSAGHWLTGVDIVPPQHIMVGVVDTGALRHAPRHIIKGVGTDVQHNVCHHLALALVPIMGVPLTAFLWGQKRECMSFPTNSPEDEESDKGWL